MPKRTGFAHGVPSWVHLSTTDVDAARTFYGQLFGWRWTGNDTPIGTYWMASLKGELIAGLSGQPPSMHGVPSTWNTYINVDHVDEATARAQAAGAHIAMPPMDIGEEGRMVFVTDPSGAGIGMWQARNHMGAGLVNEPGALIWNEVYAPDTTAIVAFYHQVFGWDAGAIPFGDDGENSYTTFKVGDAMVGGTAPPAPNQLPPTDSPQGKIAFLRDPTGAAFSVITAEPAG